MTAAEDPERAGSGLFRWPRKILRDIRAEGLPEVASWGVRLLTTRYREWRLGIQTRANVYWDDADVDPTCTYYQPLDYASLDFLLARLEIRRDEDVFLDYGSGKGRVLAVAATHPFKRVIGVEMSDALCAVARQNLAAARSRRCQAVEIAHTDATDYRVPADVNVIYLYNPFTGHILDAVMDQIRASLIESPRKLSILYLVHDSDPNGLADCEWLSASAEFILPTRKHIRFFHYENSEHSTR